LWAVSPSEGNPSDGPGRTATPRHGPGAGRLGRVTRTVTLLGSTGSIGTQAVDVVRRHPDRLAVVGLSAGGSDPAALADQVLTLGVTAVAVADPAAGLRVLEEVTRLAAERGVPAVGLELLTGRDAATRLAGRGADVVLNGITGSVGL